jgi:subtilisin-like proprotein convertase family protein/subtilisin family serine protease
MRILFCTIAAFCVSLSSLAGTLKESYRLKDRGHLREFVVARDEIHGARKAKRIAPQQNAERTRQVAAQEKDSEVVLYPAGEPRSAENRRLLTKRLLVKIRPGADIQAIAARAGSRVASGPRGQGLYVLQTFGGAGAALEALEKIRGVDVFEAEPLLAREQQKRSVNDELFSGQWHLSNSGQGGGISGIDANIIPAWAKATGAGVTIAIVDDGLQHSHPDLAPNYDATNSFDFNGGDPDPEPPAFFGDDHGTSCAGVAAARGNNFIGVAGAAYDARLAGLRLISFPVTDEEEADCFAFHNDQIDIKSNSWGPFDNGKALEGPGPLTIAALEDGVANGRGGRGTIFVFAAGNGRGRKDNSNFDGYANRRETIAISAVDNFGFGSIYSEPGANIVVAAPSDGGTLGITTTDRIGDDGYNFDGFFGELSDLDYTNTFGGTSSSCPLVAGVIALMLEVNPNLGWRDVQEILIRSAAKVDSTDPDWIDNGAGFHFHHQYGAGLIDAEAAVNLAEGWTNLGPNISYEDQREGLGSPIPDGKSRGVEFTFNVPPGNLRVEHAELTTQIAHSRRGQLEITLTSPDGTVSRLAERRPRDKGVGYSWTFLSTHHWGEAAAGDWKVKIVDRSKGSAGSVQGLTLKLWGSAPQGAIVGNEVRRASDNALLSSLPVAQATSVEFPIQNRGSATLSNLSVVAIADPNVSVTVTPPPFTSLAPGESAKIAANVQATGAVGSRAKFKIVVSGANNYSETLSYELPIGNLQTLTFTSDTSQGAIALPEFRSFSGAGKAGKYPSNITASGLPFGSVVVDVKVRLSHFNVGRSADIDALLVSPTGEKMILLSDVGSESAPDVDLLLSDSAALPLPSTGRLSSGTWRPANYQTIVDKFRSPAPSKPYQFSFSAFRGVPAAGDWSLFLMDDKTGGFGGLASWTLELTVAHP